MASEKQQRLAEPEAWEREEPASSKERQSVNLTGAECKASIVRAQAEWDAKIAPLRAELNKAASAAMRQFPSGATRNTDSDKLDPNGFIHPLTLLAFCQYMHIHRQQADGQLRDSNNWWKGIPREAYAKSLERHVLLDVKPLLAGFKGHTTQDLVEALCASWFNVQGLLLEVLLGREPK